jgi:ribonuclease P protein component
MSLPTQAKTQPRTGERLLRAARLRARAEFLRVQRDGYRFHTDHLVVLLREAAEQKLGITVTRRVGPAHERNRIKRVAKEVFRRNRDAFPATSEIVLIAKHGAQTLGYEAMRAELLRANLVKRVSAAQNDTARLAANRSRPTEKAPC